MNMKFKATLLGLSIAAVLPTMNMAADTSISGHEQACRRTGERCAEPYDT